MKKIVINVALGLLFSLSAAAGNKVKYWNQGGSASGWLYEPNIKMAGLPGVVLIHEWWGVTPGLLEFAQKFADQGYVALVVDLYGGQKTKDPKVARKLSSQVRANKKEAFNNLKAAVNFLKTHPNVSPKRLASVGWCFGGGWSYEMARNNLGVKASVIYYGFFNPKDDLSIMRSTILGHFGEDDRVIKVDGVREFQAQLKTLKGDHQIYIYENAGHAFQNPDSKNFNKAAAEKAWQRTFRFLGDTL